MSGISLVISDIDGTLITSNHELTHATLMTARVLGACGIRLSLASSRPPRSILPIAANLGLKAAFAAFNGALLVEPGGEPVIESTIAPEVSSKVKSIADALTLDVWIYDAMDWWVGQQTPFVDREEHTSGFSARLDGYAERLTKPVNKLTVVGRPEQVAKAEEWVLEELKLQVSASRSKPRFLDVTSCGWHKGSVVDRFAELFATSRDEIAVIGDGLNDVEMFVKAGVSIAMGQSVNEVRERAQFVTTSNDDEGWARGMRKYVLGVN